MPRIILQGGYPNYYRAVFTPNIKITDKHGHNPGWHTVCAPLAPLDKNGNLPSNVNGTWHMAAPNDILGGLPPVPGFPSPNAAWDDLIDDVTAIELPVDFTGNPAERIGYDNICIHEGDCTDYCDPEPLCYWQHEWNCEYAKRYKWYSKFEALMKKFKIKTFNKKTCICEVLKDECEDRCDIAEQEFMALLLNLASGKLKGDCCLEGCPGLVFIRQPEVQDVIGQVDGLLAMAGRTDYDCANAMEILTGINEDVTLCDSEVRSKFVQRCDSIK